MHERPRLTIVTPTHNRAHTLRRPWQSLLAQASSDIEWIVVDDGSTDGTTGLVAELARTSPFDVHFLAPGRVGKPAASNLGISRARGELTLVLDSDDELTPGAVSAILSWWDAAAADKGRLAGLCGGSIDQHGSLQGKGERRQPYDMRFSDRWLRHRDDGTYLCVFRTDLLRRFPFPEVDYMVPEGMTWDQITRIHPARFIPDVLLVYHRDTPGSIMNTFRLRYNRGFAHHMAYMLNTHGTQFWRRPLYFAKGLANYSRWTTHSATPWPQARQALETPWSRLAASVARPIGLALARRDRRRHLVDDSSRWRQ